MERHNERKNENYSNPDIEIDKAHLNVHFKKSEGSYLQQFDKMLECGEVSTRGQKQDANIMTEMIFDVNSEYFEQSGGYEYARDFFEEAYRMAVKEVGSEQYILSAVMHADERNKALSEQLGKDVYHYHLHVVYLPVVRKEIKWTKRCKDPELVGTVKGVINQVSHSKKWASQMVDGKLVKSYSLLQDRFFEHMRAAGFDGFERGERGSTAQHLEVVEYKTVKEKERLEALQSNVEKNETTLKNLEKKIGGIKGKAAVKEKIDKLPIKISKPIFGGDESVTMSKKDYDTLVKTAISAPYVKTHERLKETEKELENAKTEIGMLKPKAQKSKALASENEHWKSEVSSLQSKLSDERKRAEHWISQARVYELNYNRTIKELNQLKGINRSTDISR